MQQFVVPQFIDNEDKILGPITVRQFVIMLATVLILVVFYKTLAFSYFLFVALVLGGFGIALAFVKVNGRAFHYFLLNFAQVAIRPALRVWQQEIMSVSKDKNNQDENINKTPPTKVVKPKQVNSSRLSELSLLVDTGGEYKPDQSI